MPIGSAMEIEASRIITCKQKGLLSLSNLMRSAGRDVTNIDPAGLPTRKEEENTTQTHSPSSPPADGYITHLSCPLMDGQNASVFPSTAAEAKKRGGTYVYIIHTYWRFFFSLVSVVYCAIFCVFIFYSRRSKLIDKMHFLYFCFMLMNDDFPQ